MKAEILNAFSVTSLSSVTNSMVFKTGVILQKAWLLILSPLTACLSINIAPE